jgi:hypothetical protein
MAIESTRLVIGSEKIEGRYGNVTPPPVCVNLIPIAPVVGNTYRDLDGTWQVVSKPTADNEVIVQLDNSSYTAKIWIGKNDVWLPVLAAISVIDPRTGKPKDPNAAFYDPLAS